MTPPAQRVPFTLAELLAALPAGARVLDLGCGAGTFRYGSYPELRIQAVDEARREAVADFPAHVEFARGVASAIPAGDAAFDLVVANFVFEHVPDAASALGEVERVLRDGGRAWMSMPNAGSFEDQLYRNLFAGGGHLQRPTFEWFLRHVYGRTSLRLIAYVELAAGFTFLGPSEELRHLTWALVDALRRSVAVDARSRSGYVFLLEKRAASGPGYVEYLRTCSTCGTPDLPAAAGGEADRPDPRGAEDWNCGSCAAVNHHPAMLPIARLDEVARALRAEWERYPEIRPERLRELVEERSRWGLALEGELARERAHAASLEAERARLEREFDERGRWALGLEAELGRERAVAATLAAELAAARSELSAARDELAAIPPILRRLAARLRRLLR